MLHRSQCIPSYLHHNPIPGSEKCKCTSGTLDNSSTSGNGTFITIQSWKLDSYTINLLRACSWEKAVKEARMQDMTGGSQAKIRVQLTSSLTLFPPGALVTEWQHRTAPPEAKGPGSSPPCILESFCHWPLATPREGLCNLLDIYRWGSSY